MSQKFILFVNIFKTRKRRIIEMKKNIIKGLVISAFAFSAPVFSDTTQDLVNALVTKGILTEDEAALLTKQHAGESKARDQKVKSKLSISKYLDEGKLYGDIRVRQEWRDADEYGGNESIDRSRQRYKITLRFKTKISENWFTDLALAMGSNVDQIMQLLENFTISK